MKNIKQAVIIGAIIALYSSGASAELTNQGILDTVISRFGQKASVWKDIILNAATWLFWTLGTISLAWTGAQMMLRKADIGEFFAEFIKFIMFFGFFLWLLRNGPDFAMAIINSLSTLAQKASNTSVITPSTIVDLGFMIWKRAVTGLSVWSPVDSFTGLILSGGVLIILAIVAINMLLLFVSAWILVYAGIFFLGFGGSRWTSDMAINYYKTVLGLATQIFTMILVIGIGNDLLIEFYNKMSKGTLNFEELGVMLIVCLCLLILTNKLPPMVSGIITGASVGGAGIGGFGAGAILGGAGVAAAAAATGGAMIAAGAANAAGGAQAIMAAFSKASENVSSGSDVVSSMMGGGGSDSGASENSSPFAEAAGFGGVSGGSSGGSEGGSSGGSSGGSEGDSSGGSSGGSEGGSSGGSSGGTEGGSSGGSEGGSANQGADTMKGQPADSGGSSAAKGGFMAAAAAGAAKAGKITADAGANLAKGMTDAAKAKGSSIMGSAKERIADTAGGKIADQIKNGDDYKQQAAEDALLAKADAITSGQSRAEALDHAANVVASAESGGFGGNSIGGDYQSEVDDFVNRG